uniref:Uncharacterized protein n=1 Tax=Glossina palpalis gambiensis TaxID=67801 RepID=A0A1B0BHZ8_9MUSC
MNECNAAMILVTLSHSPKSPKNGVGNILNPKPSLKDKWLGSSPGSSSASWSSGSSSPPLSDDGHNISAHMINDASASARIRTTSVSTSDEGIVVDFKEDVPRKKRVSNLFLLLYYMLSFSYLCKIINECQNT